MERIQGMDSWYKRVPSPTRQKEGWKSYKKGWEIRITVGKEEALEGLRHELIEIGYNPGRSYMKHLKLILPLYGQDNVQRFLRQFENVS